MSALRGFVCSFYSVIKALLVRFHNAVGSAFSLINYTDIIGLCVDKCEKVMSQKFHLDTCIFRIHGFDIKLLGTDDIYFLIICLFLKKLFLEVTTALLSCHKFVLILAELTLDDFFNQVNRYIVT